MVRAQISWALGSTDDAIEHTADNGSVKDPYMDSETDDSPSKLIHDNHHPVRLEDQRFTSKKIHTPQTVFAVAQESEPGRTVRSRLRPVVPGQYASNHILINLDVENQGDLVGDALVPEFRVSAFHLEDR